MIGIDAAVWSMKAGQHPMAPEIGYKPMRALLERSRNLPRFFVSMTFRRLELAAR